MNVSEFGLGDLEGIYVHHCNNRLNIATVFFK